MIKVVAENINIMSKYTGNAMREKDPKPIQEWAVKLTQKEAIDAGLQVYQPKGGPAVINSIMATPERMALQLPHVTKYGCDMVGLMWGPDGIPRDENERAVLLDTM